MNPRKRKKLRARWGWGKKRGMKKDEFNEKGKVKQKAV